jgi:hypothetical protein
MNVVLPYCVSQGILATAGSGSVAKARFRRRILRSLWPPTPNWWSPQHPDVPEMVLAWFRELGTAQRSELTATARFSNLTPLLLSFHAATKRGSSDVEGGPVIWEIGSCGRS